MIYTNSNLGRRLLKKPLDLQIEISSLVGYFKKINRDYFIGNAYVPFLFTSCVVSENERVNAANKWVFWYYTFSSKLAIKLRSYSLPSLVRTEMMNSQMYSFI